VLTLWLQAKHDYNSSTIQLQGATSLPLLAYDMNINSLHRLKGFSR